MNKLLVLIGFLFVTNVFAEQLMRLNYTVESTDKSLNDIILKFLKNEYITTDLNFYLKNIYSQDGKTKLKNINEARKNSKIFLLLKIKHIDKEKIEEYLRLQRALTSESQKIFGIGLKVLNTSNSIFIINNENQTQDVSLNDLIFGLESLFILEKEIYKLDFNMNYFTSQNKNSEGFNILNLEGSYSYKKNKFFSIPIRLIYNRSIYPDAPQDFSEYESIRTQNNLFILGGLAYGNKIDWSVFKQYRIDATVGRSIISNFETTEATYQAPSSIYKLNLSLLTKMNFEIHSSYFNISTLSSSKKINSSSNNFSIGVRRAFKF